MISFQSLFSLFSGALYILFSHCSSLDIRHSTLPFSCTLSSSHRCFCLFFTLSIPISRFSRLAPRLLSSFSLWSLSLWSLSLCLFSLFLPFGKEKSFSYEYRCFASLLEIAKYQESLFNNNLTSMISRSKHRLQILSLRCFTSFNPHETFLVFYKHLWCRILSLFSLSSLRLDILVLACLRLNQTLAAKETETRQIPYFSAQSCHDHWNLV